MTTKGKSHARLSRVGTTGRVTIPARVRQAAGIQPGDTILFWYEGGRDGQFTVISTHESVDELLDRFSGSGRVPEDFWTDVGTAIAEDVISDNNEGT